MPVCSKMLYLVSLATTVLMSAEVMLLDALVRFCDWSVSTVDAACSCSTVAPRVPRSCDTAAMAVEMASRAEAAAVFDVNEVALRESAVEDTEATVAEIVTVPDEVPSLVKAETVELKREVPLKLVELLILSICCSRAWYSLLIAVDCELLRPVLDPSVASVTARFSSVVTWESAPSAVCREPTALVAFSEDCVRAATLAFRPSDMERPAASSEPELIRDPEDSC